MIWHYFPIGMRFPVADFSDDTKRACWKVALNAAFSCDVTQTGLYEACEPFDPISQSPVYICIICFVGIKQSRAAGETLHSLDMLMSHLCLHKPLIQANDLENYGPYPILAEIDAQGAIRPNEDGIAFIPTEQPVPMHKNEGACILIAPGPVKNPTDAEHVSRMLGTAAADHGFRIKRIPIAVGGEGTVRTLVVGTAGRYETVLCEDINGERKNMLVGVMPGSVAVIEAADVLGASCITDKTPPAERRSSFGVGMLIRKVLDLGYRKIWIGLGDAVAYDLGLGALAALGVRFTDAEGNAVLPCAAELCRIVDIDRTDLDPRIKQTELTILFNDDTTLRALNNDVVKGTLEKDYIRLAQMLGAECDIPGSGAAGGLSFALCSVGGKLLPGVQTIRDRIGLAEALANADFFIGGYGLDPKELMQTYPNLKGAAECPILDEADDEMIKAFFDRSVFPAFGKDVVNHTNL